MSETPGPYKVPPVDPRYALATVREHLARPAPGDEPVARYVLRYTHPAPKPPYTRVVKLAIAAADYEDLTFTIDHPIGLTDREAAAYCAVKLPPGLVLTRVPEHDPQEAK
jgi:hypothetical protein